MSPFSDSFVDLKLDNCSGSKKVASAEASSEDPFTFRRQKRSVRQRLSSPGNIDEEPSHGNLNEE